MNKIALKMIAPTKSDKPTLTSRQQAAELVAGALDAAQRAPSADRLRAAADYILRWLRKRRERLAGSTWTRYFRKLAVGLRKMANGDNKTPFRVFVEGNGKLPFAAFSTLPVFTCPGAGECAKWCYSFTGWRYPAVIARQLQNTLLIRYAPHLIAERFMALPHGVQVRLYVDGDFGTAGDLDFWMAALEQRPDLLAYGYTKSWRLILERSASGKAWPANYQLNVSSGASYTPDAEQLAGLSIVRGAFVAVDIRDEYRTGKTGNMGFARYDDPEYHRAVRRAAAKAGLGRKVFSCPGKCGDCTKDGPACGLARFKGMVIANGMH